MKVIFLPEVLDYFEELAYTLMEYSIFRKSKRTAWYVFFRVYKEMGNEIFQIRYIANNHTIAQYLI